MNLKLMYISYYSMITFDSIRSKIDICLYCVELYSLLNIPIFLQGHISIVKF